MISEKQIRDKIYEIQERKGIDTAIDAEDMFSDQHSKVQKELGPSMFWNDDKKALAEEKMQSVYEEIMKM